jgi:hypothetical protein
MTPVWSNVRNIIVFSTWVGAFTVENPSMFSMHYSGVKCHNNGVHVLAGHVSLTANH